MYIIKMFAITPILPRRFFISTYIQRVYTHFLAKKVCKSLYQFDFYIDRFMDSSEILRTINTDKVEDCLSRCLDETEFTCRSISFNRTASVCSLSPQSQISKPGYLRVNNNPNYRIDYYENNCYNGKQKQDLMWLECNKFAS